MAKKKKPKLVHYDPGDAPGSPAWLPEDEAKKQLAKDEAYLEKMEQVGIKTKKFPSIKGE
jgi:hypothetical protein